MPLTKKQQRSKDVVDEQSNLTISNEVNCRIAEYNLTQLILEGIVVVEPIPELIIENGD